MLGRFSEFIATHSPTGDASTPLVSVLALVTGSILGFIGLYLEVRIVLSPILRDVENYMKTVENILTGTVRGLTNSLATIDDKALADSADSLRTASNIMPQSSSLRNAATQALVAAGRVEEASDLVAHRASPSADDQIMQMLVYLYETPDGFRKVISIGNDLSNNPAAQKRADYWFYLGCAYGQEHQACIAENGSPEKLELIRENAIKCVRNAIKINPAFKARFYLVAYPEKSGTPSDNDMQSFQNDKEFNQLVGT
jgi:hypothetical protein